MEQLPADVRARLHPSVGASATTDQIAHAAREAGYDSVTVRNVHDNRWGERPIAGAQPRTIDFVFNTENIRPLDSIPPQASEAARSAEKVKLTAADRALLDELGAPDAPNAGPPRTPPRTPPRPRPPRTTRVYHATDVDGFDVPTRANARRGEGISVTPNREVASEYGRRVLELDLRGRYPDLASPEMEAVQQRWQATRAETGRSFEEELLASGFDGYRDGDTIFVARDGMLSRADAPNAGPPRTPPRTPPRPRPPRRQQ